MKRVRLTSGPQRRGAITVFLAISLTVMIVFVAIALDLSLLYTTKNELQRSADAAALAGASAFVSDAALVQDRALLRFMIEQRARHLAGQNVTLGSKTLLASRDILTGWYDHENGSFDPSAERHNAVRVFARRTDTSPNGAVLLAFAPVFSERFGNVSARALAVVDDRFAGYRVRENGPFIPFTVHEEMYQRMLGQQDDDFAYVAEDGTLIDALAKETGEDRYSDDYRYDEESGAVVQGSDGVEEINLYPWKWKDLEGYEVSGYDGNDGSGNFGLLNVGIDSTSTTELGLQILNGITATQIEAETGTSELTFYNDSGEPTTYDVTGTPGIRGSLRDEVASRHGEVVGFFIHDNVDLGGSNATYRITGVRFARVMLVEMQGRPDRWNIVLQPVAYADSNVIVSEDAPSSNGQISRVVLAQ